MMVSNIRKEGVTYLRKVLGYNPVEPIAVSKYFPAEESWTKKPTWWFDLRIDRVRNNKRGGYYLVGKTRKRGFVVLKILNKFLLDNLENFETRYKDRIRLPLAAEGKDLLVDERGKGRVGFSRFELTI
jgi:hypothetical protein